MLTYGIFCHRSYHTLIKEEVKVRAGSRTVIDCCSLIPAVTSN